MKIGIIGAGNIGGNLTRRFAAAGHDVSVANSRGPETLADLAAETGAKAVTVGEAAAGALARAKARTAEQDARDEAEDDWGKR